MILCLDRDGSLLWRHDLDSERPESSLPAAVCAGAAIAATDQSLRAFDISGRVSWSRELAAPAEQLIALARSVVVLSRGTAGAVLTSHGVTDGRLEWSTVVGTSRCLVVVDRGGAGLFVVDGGGVHRIDAATGRQVWRFCGDRRDFGSGGSLPTVRFGRTAMVLTGDVSTAVVSKESGALLWAQGSTGGSQTPTLMADEVLLTATDGSVGQSAVVSASRLLDGALLWERHLPAERCSTVHCSTVATARGVAVLNVGGFGPGAQTVGLQLSTGRDLWRSPRPAMDGRDSPSRILGVTIAYFQHPAFDSVSPDVSELVIRNLRTGRLLTIDRRIRCSASGPVVHGYGRYFAVVSNSPDSGLESLSLIDLREARVLYRRDIDLRPLGTPAVTSAGRLVCTLAPISTATAA